MLHSAGRPRLRLVPRLGPEEARRLLRWLTVLVVADVLVFAIFCSDGFLAGRVNIEPSRANAVAQLGHRRSILPWSTPRARTSTRSRTWAEPT